MTIIKYAISISILFFVLMLIAFFGGLISGNHFVSNIAYHGIAAYFEENNARGKGIKFPDVANSKNNGKRYKVSFIALNKIDEFYSHRRVLVSYSVPIDVFPDLDVNGKIRNLENKASIWAPKLALAECEYLLEYLASKCNVNSSSIRYDQSTEHYKPSFLVKAELQFVQKENFGEVPKTNLSFVESEASLLEDEFNLGWASDLEQQALKRIVSYQSALEQCNAMREMYGNCAISEIQIKSRLDRVSGGVEVKYQSHANFAFLNGAS